ncbi:YceI family protein [Mesoflavibacter sp. SCSIO 43206]|uniref:YceI family protein n=1 Tax=Mesoflavibacter sp. SCSIO 43206 TaxID=2779362 RepID=UPI001CA7C2A5|nr:YceI family protein [Mesoflavibacter sp. SCSIO 43206]UAB75698.1 YceI family protein [Mesoflavibacter sp. SCSIO 43206]
MNSQIKLKVTLLTLVTFLSFSIQIFSQSYKVSNASSDLKVYGTSSLHDWHVDAEDVKGSLQIEVSEEALSIKKLNVEIISESLKSGKKSMDKNTYKALETDKYSSIKFNYLSTKSITKVSDNTYSVEAYGNLSITGNTQKILLKFKLKTEDNKVSIVGEKSIKMTSYGVEPPTALLGTIKTGDDLTIKFNIKLQ